MSASSVLHHVRVLEQHGLLAYLGVAFLHQYLWVARHTVPGAEYLSVLAIMASVVVGGYAVGLVVGLVFATVRFLVLSGRDDPVRAARTGREVHSRAYRTPQDAAHLREAGDLIRVVHLTGFLFFGTSAQIADGLRTSVLGVREGACSPRFVVLDLTEVNGVDATAAMGLGRVVQVADGAGAQVVTAGAASEVWAQLEAAGLGRHIPPERRFDTVDAALEHAEDVVLAEAGRHGHVDDPLALLRSSFALPETFAVVQDCMEQVTCAPGEVVVEAGAPGRDLYVVARGRVRVERASGTAGTRVRTLGPGDMLGEGAFYAGRRGAHVHAETEAELHRIDGAQLDRAFANAPEAAADFHRAMARLLSERLGEANRADGALLR